MTPLKRKLKILKSLKHFFNKLPQELFKVITIFFKAESSSNPNISWVKYLTKTN